MLRLAVLVALVLTAAHAAARATARPAPDATDTAPYGVWPSFSLPGAAEEPDQLPGFIDSVLVNVNPTTYIPANVDADQAAKNLRATLDAIAWCEGTLNDMGYRTMFGYRYFDSFADHPRQYFEFRNQAGQLLYTSAAGRYQIIIKTWDALRDRLGLPDFSPASQDAAAVELIRERGALQDAYAGRMEAVADKCRATWASLPGSNVAQPTRTMSQVIAAYQNAGGTLA